MALLRFVQHNYGLPDPKGSLSSKASAAAIAHATHEVQAESQRYTGKGEDETCHTIATAPEVGQQCTPYSSCRWHCGLHEAVT